MTRQDKHVTVTTKTSSIKRLARETVDHVKDLKAVLTFLGAIMIEKKLKQSQSTLVVPISKNLETSDPNNSRKQ